MPIYSLPPPPPFRPAAPDPNELSGEDIYFSDQLVVVSGDWQAVRGVVSAEQSVRREACANVGSLLRRSSWGMGITQSLFKSVTTTLSSEILTRVKNRMRLNPRVGKFVDARVVRLSGIRGISVAIQYVPVGAQKAIETTLRGVR